MIYVGRERVEFDRIKFSDQVFNNFEYYYIFSTWGPKNPMGQVYVIFLCLSFKGSKNSWKSVDFFNRWKYETL